MHPEGAGGWITPGGIYFYLNGEASAQLIIFLILSELQSFLGVSCYTSYISQQEFEGKFVVEILAGFCIDDVILACSTLSFHVEMMSRTSI
jgi:hypothetical protein